MCPETKCQIVIHIVSVITESEIPQAVKRLLVAVEGGRVAPDAREVHADDIRVALVTVCSLILHHTVTSVVVPVLVIDVETAHRSGDQYGLHQKVHVATGEDLIRPEGIKLKVRCSGAVGSVRMDSKGFFPSAVCGPGAVEIFP